jgi:hypothetical protein
MKFSKENVRNVNVHIIKKCSQINNPTIYHMKWENREQIKLQATGKKELRLEKKYVKISIEK